MCFQLIHFLPDVGSHLSWLETEHKAGILMTVTPHPSASSSASLFYLSSHHLHPPFPPPPRLLFIPSTHTLHSVCSTDFLPPVSFPQFYPPHLDSLPVQLHSVDPNFAPTPPLLLSISASDLALLLLLLSLSLTSYIIRPPHSSSLLPISCAPTNSSPRLAFSIPLNLACLFCFGSPLSLV